MTTIVDRHDLEAALRTGDVVLVDALPESYFNSQHLPGAINLVAEDVNTRANSLLPDKEARIVTYCSNSACPNSGSVAAKLEALGYTNVAKYAAGIQDWVEAGLPTESTQRSYEAARP